MAIKKKFFVLQEPSFSCPLRGNLWYMTVHDVDRWTFKTWTYQDWGSSEDIQCPHTWRRGRVGHDEKSWTIERKRICFPLKMNGKGKKRSAFEGTSLQIMELLFSGHSCHWHEQQRQEVVDIDISKVIKRTVNVECPRVLEGRIGKDWMVSPAVKSGSIFIGSWNEVKDWNCFCYIIIDTLMMMAIIIIIITWSTIWNVVKDTLTSQPPGHDGSWPWSGWFTGQWYFGSRWKWPAVTCDAHVRRANY